LGRKEDGRQEKKLMRSLKRYLPIILEGVRRKKRRKAFKPEVERAGNGQNEEKERLPYILLFVRYTERKNRGRENY